VVEPLARLAHILVGALSFVLFGILGVLLTLLVFPLLYLIPSTRSVREVRAQRILHWSFRTYRAVMTVTRCISVEVLGEERLRAPGPHLVIANHPTLLDIVILGSLMPQLDCIAKRAAWSNPFLFSVVRATGCLPNDSGPSLVEACTARLQQGRSLLIFPEGTRSPADGLQPFQRGMAHVALRADAPILPICIRCTPPTLGKGRRWWQMPTQTLRYTLEVGDPVEATLLAPPGGSRGVAVRRVSAALRDFYLKKLHYTER
jgi:1-acyl-sn-glycerol-3-phosphate acyltransferase